MANQSNYYPNGRRTYMSSLPSISSTDSGHFHGHAREMGPPVPQPVEIADLSISRTLPSPSVAGSSNIELLPPPPHAFGDMPYGDPNMSRVYPFPTDGQMMRPQDPIQGWYSAQDGPWSHIPKVMPSIPDGRFQSKQTGSRNHISSGVQYRHHPSETGSFHVGVPHSDSGYGTRRSVANTSVFSGDIPDRDQDCQSLTGHVENFQPFLGYNEDIQQRDARPGAPWPTSVPELSESRGMVCPTCQKPVKTQSEMKKHDLRHRKPFQCEVPGCNRTEGFSTPNDLDRHMRSKHSRLVTSATGVKKFRCLVPGCKSKDKAWPRLDNFKSHLRRVHLGQLATDEALESLVKSGEFWEQPGHVEESSVEKHTLRDLVQPHINFALQESSTRPRNGSAGTPYPDVIEPAHDLIAPKGPQAGFFEQRAATSEERSTLPEQQAIVKPGDVLRNPIPESITLARVSLVSAGRDDLALSRPDQVKSHATSKNGPHGKASRQNNASAATATVTEAFKTILAELDQTDTSNDHHSNSDLERSSLPNEKSSMKVSWATGPNPAMSASKAQGSNTADPLRPSQGAKDPEADKKALKVLQLLTDLGFTVSKDPTHSPKQHNTGSAASQKSENQVTCQTCKKFTGRPCELKKHMKRHERPYGCTFMTCNKVFGSKNDWKRHENSQHFHLEIWRCGEVKPDETKCAKVCYRRQPFQEHLRKEHQINEDVIKAKTEEYRLGRNCQERFWCGFCVKSIELKKKGLEAWTERFDHIDDHFMGRGMAKQSIRDWIPVESDKPKGEVDSSSNSGDYPDKESSSSDHSGDGSPTGILADPNNAGESSANAGNLEAPNPVGSKRRMGEHEGESSRSPRPAKRSKTNTSRRAVNVRICCECGQPHNPKLHTGCSNCDKSHRWCENCQTDVEMVNQEP